MALLSPIEIISGSDRSLQALVWTTWLAAVCSILYHSHRMPLLLMLICCLALLWSFPLRNRRILKHQNLLFQANGQVQCGEIHDTWRAVGWRNSRYTVIRIGTGRHAWSAWICASQNTPADYRRLGVWSRFPPQGETGHASSSPS